MKKYLGKELFQWVEQEYRVVSLEWSGARKAETLTHGKGL